MKGPKTVPSVSRDRACHCAGAAGVVSLAGGVAAGGVAAGGVVSAGAVDVAGAGSVAGVCVPDVPNRKYRMMATTTTAIMMMAFRDMVCLPFS